MSTMKKRGKEGLERFTEVKSICCSCGVSSKVPRTHIVLTTIYNSGSRGPNTFLVSVGTTFVYSAHRYMVANTHTHKIKNHLMTRTHTGANTQAHAQGGKRQVPRMMGGEIERQPPL